VGVIWKDAYEKHQVVDSFCIISLNSNENFLLFYLNRLLLILTLRVWQRLRESLLVSPYQSWSLSLRGED